MEQNITYFDSTESCDMICTQGVWTSERGQKEREDIKNTRKRDKLVTIPSSLSHLSLLCLFSFGHRIRSYILFFLLPDATLWKQGCRAIYSPSLLKFLGVSRQIQYLTLLWVEAESYFPLKMKRVGWNELMLFSLSFLFISSSSSSLHLFPLLVPSLCLWMIILFFSLPLFSHLLHNYPFGRHCHFSFFTSLPVLSHHLHPLLK